MHDPRPHNRFRSALTRLEVGVTLAVLGVMFALLFPSLLVAIRTPQESKLREEAGRVVKNIVTACKLYATEHGGFPSIAAASDGQEGNRYLSFGDTNAGRCKVDNSELFNVLRGISAGANTGDVLNKTKTRYFEGKKATNPKLPRQGFADGPEFPEAIRGQLFDPWGTEYCVVLNVHKDGMLNLGDFYRDLSGWAEKVQDSVAAFSLGKDQKRGGENYEGLFRKPNSDDAPDDIVSWQ
jgi:type II secretory pathway pseudopilin PulG